MTPARLFALALLASAIAFGSAQAAFTLELAPELVDLAGDRARQDALLQSVRQGEAASSEFRDRRAVIEVYAGGEVQSHAFGETLGDAYRALSEDTWPEDTWPEDTWPPSADSKLVVTFIGEEGPVLASVPMLSGLSLVPINEGVVGRAQGRVAYPTPEEIRLNEAYDSGATFLVSDIRFGVNWEWIASILADRLNVEADEVELRRFTALSVTESAYPGPAELSELQAAAVDGARFLLRHQQASGAFAYRYDGRTGQDRGRYNFARHFGTAYYLAQTARLTSLEGARSGALRAIAFARHHRVRTCGPSDHLCVIDSDEQGSVGPTALLAIAITELLDGQLEGEPETWSREDRDLRTLLLGLARFLQSQQRDDGELMHDYDRQHSRPIDVQHMYYSGEGLLALLMIHRVVGDEASLTAARRLVGHLTGDAWEFFGSDYYYGAEHWTCISVGEGWDRLHALEPEMMEGALDFCLDWFRWYRGLQFGAGETPWDSRGAFGVGPLLVPVITPVGSVSEAMVSIHDVAASEGRNEARVWLRAMLDETMKHALRYQWRPGPTHLFADPEGAYGAFPASPLSLEARNDYTQHVGSAMLRWHFSRAAGSGGTP